MKNKIDLTNAQIRQAARSTLALLNDDGRVSIPPSMALSGDFSVMITILGSIVNKEVIVANPVPPEEGQTPSDKGVQEK